MCGIHGVLHLDKGPGSYEEAMDCMGAALSHRGPCETGRYADADISLGVRRLIVIDPATGSQPLASEDGSVRLVANCEVYGFEETAQRLASRGHVLRSCSDAEVLVHLYEDHGTDMLESVSGMFAFALWDSRARRLLLARDRFGIKPLFYAELPGGGLAFASEIQSLLQVPQVPRDLDPVAIDDFFTLSYVPHPRTAYARVRKLAPGCLLVADASGIRQHSYWTLPRERAPLSRRESLEALDEAISSSVRRMLYSDVPVAALLSGGLDSGTVVHHMTRHAHDRVTTYGVRFLEKEFDEGPRARETADWLGTTHRDVWTLPEHVRLLPELVRHFGEPFADPALIPTYLVCREASRDHVVLLSGDGGDEVLGGYATYVASMLADSLTRSWWASRAVWLAAAFADGRSSSRWSKFLANVHRPRLERQEAWRTVLDSEARARLYVPEFAAAQEPRRGPFERWAQLLKLSDPLLGYQLLDVRTYLTDNNLTRVDRMSMASSVEVRVPLLDEAVFAAALQLPPELRTRRFATKIGLRELMRKRLPSSVVRMKKRGFGVPLSSWFRGPLRDYVAETLASDRVAATGILDVEAVLSTIGDHLNRRIDNARRLWSLMCFVHWHEWQRGRPDRIKEGAPTVTDREGGSRPPVGPQAAG